VPAERQARHAPDLRTSKQQRDAVLSAARDEVDDCQALLNGVFTLQESDISGRDGECAWSRLDGRHHLLLRSRRTVGIDLAELESIQARDVADTRAVEV